MRGMYSSASVVFYTALILMAMEMEIEPYGLLGLNEVADWGAGLGDNLTFG